MQPVTRLSRLNGISGVEWRARGPPSPLRRTDESATDKIKPAWQNMRGKAKEARGKASHDKTMQARGKTDQAAADLKQAGENVKDTFKDGT
jgi:uncharacterized protein YjbJ (UPF0337 family)